MINRLVKSYGFVFPQCVESKFLIHLTDLGSIPIVKLQNGSKKQYTTNLAYAFNLLFARIKPCSITDIKEILFAIAEHKRSGERISANYHLSFYEVKYIIDHIYPLLF